MAKLTNRTVHGNIIVYDIVMTDRLSAAAEHSLTTHKNNTLGVMNAFVSCDGRCPTIRIERNRFPDGEAGEQEVTKGITAFEQAIKTL